MKFIRLLVVLSVCGLALGAQAGTIYLCKAYSGGTFWAKAHCNQHSALIEVAGSLNGHATLGTTFVAVCTGLWP